MEFINSFPGYEFKDVEGCLGKQNIYRGTNLGFGGYVYFEAGAYSNVALLDIQSLHPASIISLNKFGKYTQKYKELRDLRVAIKEHDFDKARTLLGGTVAEYLTNEEEADQLAQAAKLILNSTYGFCSATFDNPFRDSRDKNNIVALKGALFMRTLQDEVQKRGFTVAHIKTDSIKVPNATKEIVDFIMEFAKPYGYIFEHEATYDRMCLVNGSTYIAKYSDCETCEKLYGYVPKKNKKCPNQWTATAKQFQVPYVFKTLFSKEPIEFSDLCETKEVKTAIYLDKNEGYEDVSLYEDLAGIRTRAKSVGYYDLNKKEERLLKSYSYLSDEDLIDKIEKGHNYTFVGKVGNFCPVKPGCGGGILVREAKDEFGNVKYDSVTGTLKPDKTPYRWLESEFVKKLGKENDIDKSYYRKLVDDAVDTISQYCDFEQFVSDAPFTPDALGTLPEHPLDDDELPWYEDEELENFKRR